MLLEEILRNLGDSLQALQIDMQRLVKGELTYEEVQLVLKDNPTTNFLSVNLKQKLAASKQIDFD